MNSLRQARRAG